MSGRSSNHNAKTPTKRSRLQMHWGMVPAEYLRSIIHDVTSEGCALVLGRTSNGSALSVCILAGADKVRDYIGSMDDVEPVLEALLDDVGITRIIDIRDRSQDA